MLQGFVCNDQLNEGFPMKRIFTAGEGVYEVKSDLPDITCC